MALSARFSDALVLACQLHAEQRRKGSDVPYVAHLLGVAAIALEHGADEDEAIAAVLHDAVDDQGGAAVREDIRGRFGDRVTRIVDDCSDSGAIPKPPWRQRKERYLAHLAVADASARLVCAADKLHNVRSLIDDYRSHGEALWQRFNGGREGTLWYYRAVVTALGTTSHPRLVAALAREVRALEHLAAGHAEV
jgi:(p)ppGpp synthase/HD superfamily hydrolase